MKVFEEQKAALIVLSADDLKRFNYKKGDTEGLVNVPLSIPDIIYSVFIREDEREIKISTRAKGISVSMTSARSIFTAAVM